MEKSVILFDLDGTLTDPKIGITKAVQISLREFGIEVENADTLTNFIGPPLQESYAKLYGFDPQQVEQAVQAFRRYFSEYGMLENSVYPGIRQLLERLLAAGRTLVVATSKPEVFALRILEHFDLKRYFKFVAGGELDGRRTKKSEVIAYALEQCGISDRGSVVMVGDREHDMIGAAAQQVMGVGVTYGYGSKEELEASGAALVAQSVSELETLLLGL